MAEPLALPARMPAVSRWRFVRAYSTTFLVIASYLRLSFASRIFGRGYRDRKLRGVHQRNARRVYRTILALQGLFIKVGQLLSILANFLPEEFRSELEGLQDQVPPRPYAQIVERLEEDLGGPLSKHFDAL